MYTLAEKIASSSVSSLKLPQYDHTRVSHGILHLGASMFFLSHLSKYIHDILPVDPRWGITAASLRTPDVIRTLQRARRQYILVEQSHSEREAHLVSSLTGALFAPECPHEVVKLIAHPDTKVVSMTVSAAGYHITAAGCLDMNNGDVVHDLSSPKQPRTIYWYLMHGLLARMMSAKPLVVLSLDNLHDNGPSLKAALLTFAAQYHHDLAAYINDMVDFPRTMVDRITPRMSSNERVKEANLLGLDANDSLIVRCEAFRQLVIEHSRFPLPPWEAAGVQHVNDLRPYWERKFYALNGGHMLLAIPGLHLGLEYVHEAISHEHGILSSLLKFTLEEYTCFLGEDDKYFQAIIYRFADQTSKDTLERVSARTTEKISHRVLAAVERGLEGGKLLKGALFVTACWLVSLSGKSENGQPLPQGDSHVANLRWVPAEMTSIPSSQQVKDVLKKVGVTVGDGRFGRVATNDEATSFIAWCVGRINEMGVERAIQELLYAHQK